MWRSLLFVAALLAAGCTSTPQASRERDAEAKEFRTHPGAATIYVYRSGHDRLEDLSVLYLDGRLIGQTLPAAYFRLDVVPGRRILHGTGFDAGSIVLDARPSQLYFIELRVTEGQSNFTPVSALAGRQRVSSCCAMLENWAPGQRPLLR